MTCAFISDLHLDPEDEQRTNLFLTFLENRAPRVRRLYILGDLFEYWVGDDHESELSRIVADGLARLHERGTQTYYMHGNRDFLIGAEYAAHCRMRILQDPACIQLAGRRAILAHGDTLCTDDTEYQAFRNMVRNQSWQQQFLTRPLHERLEFAREAREGSRSHTANAPVEIMDVNACAVDRLMTHLDSELLIHGHTHRPAIHQEGADRTRIVLGDWHDEVSCLWVEEDGSMDLEDPRVSH